MKAVADFLKGAMKETEARAQLMAVAPELYAELKAAHQIILNALAVMNNTQKHRWGEKNEASGILSEGVTRHHERAAVLAKAEKKNG